MNEQQQHLTNLLEQQKDLLRDIQELERAVITKREMVLKIQGVLEYLQQIGVSLPETNNDESAEVK